MPQPPLTDDELVAIILLLVVVGSLVLYVIQKAVFAYLYRHADVSSFAPGPDSDYVNAAPVAPAKTPTSGASRPEVEAEARREVRPEGDAVILSLTEKALQGRDADNYQRGMIDAYATLLKGGYLDAAVKEKKLGEMKQALAAVAGQRAPLLPGLSGRQSQALNAAIAAVPAPAPAPEEPAITPIAGRTIPSGVEFDR